MKKKFIRITFINGKEKIISDGNISEEMVAMYEIIRDELKNTDRPFINIFEKYVTDKQDGRPDGEYKFKADEHFTSLIRKDQIYNVELLELFEIEGTGKLTPNDFQKKIKA